VYEGSGGFLKEGGAQRAMENRTKEIRARDAAPPVSQKNLGDWLQQWLNTYALDRCQPKTLER
jgi:hypothetical protein